MATTNSNGGGRSKNHHLLLLLQDGNPYRHTYYSYGAPPPPGSDDANNEKVVVAVVVLFFVFMLLCFFCIPRRTGCVEEGEAETAAAEEMHVHGHGAGDDEEAPPLVCAYRKADGWREGSCGVCLSELADGEPVRVLPACMHYFHAACVNEWLRAHATCPLCRAPLAPAAAA